MFQWGILVYLILNCTLGTYSNDVKFHIITYTLTNLFPPTIYPSRKVFAYLAYFIIVLCKTPSTESTLVSLGNNFLFKGLLLTREIFIVTEI